MEARVDAPDVVIVGAGVVGAAVAYELARRGQRVLVLERAEGAGLVPRAGAWAAPTGSAPQWTPACATSASTVSNGIRR